jgi:hypothetical protein
MKTLEELMRKYQSLCDDLQTLRGIAPVRDQIVIDSFTDLVRAAAEINAEIELRKIGQECAPSAGLLPFTTLNRNHHDAE